MELMLLRKELPLELKQRVFLMGKCLRVFREVEGGPAGDGSSEWECLTTEEESHEMDINCVAWAPNCSMLASASDDETVKLWVLEES